jgi:hypothetical protein
MTEYIRGTLYTCGCGYKTLSKDYACKHSKTKRCEMQTMIKKEVEYILKEDHLASHGKSVAHDHELMEKNRMIKERDRTISQLQDTVVRLQKTIVKMTMSDDDDISTEDTQHNGIVYFVMDRDVPDRGKIGRTKNTDIKKLKTRYSTFGLPAILCYLSEDIKNDENDLKKLMREAGCMKSNTEIISNVSLARGIFYDFMTERCK